MVAAAEVLDQGALGFQVLGGLGGHTVSGPDVDGQEVTAVYPLEDPRGTPDQYFAFGAPGQSNDDALAGRPTFLDLVLCPVARQSFVHTVSEPEQRQFPQCCQVAHPEVIGQGSVDLVGIVDLAIAQALPEQLGRNVHQMDLVSAAHDVVRDGFGLLDVGDGADNIAQGGQVLHVHRGQDIDAGVQQFLNVLPALLVPAPGNVGVGILVHDRGVWAPGQDRVQVHLFEGASPVLDGPGRHDLKPLGERLGIGASVVHGECHHHVFAAAQQPVGFFEHCVSFADARCCPQKNPQCCPRHVLILPLGNRSYSRVRGQPGDVQIQQGHVDRRLAEEGLEPAAGLLVHQGLNVAGFESVGFGNPLDLEIRVGL
ncbi:hypothetical protein PJL18_03676 [Paenarthrobacter nicotinovorans]|nr:hypothetical protein [Paenarthrobacter nicotinovorans]